MTTNSPLDALLRGLPFRPLLETAHLFAASLEAELEFQSSMGGQYSRWTQSALDSSDALESLPGLPVSWFKGTSSVGAPVGEAGLSITSSGTTGRPSRIYVDRETSARQARAMSSVMSEVLGRNRKPFIIFDAPPVSGGHSVGARHAAIVGYSRFASSTQYVASADATTLLPEGKRVIEQACAASSPVVVFGFTAVLYQILSRNEDLQLTLPTGSRLIHIGGWKKLEGLAVSRESLHLLIGERLGIPGHMVTDIYGFTEQMGVNYPECRSGWKHVPSFARLRVLDPETLDPIDPGMTGLLEFTTPIPKSYPGLRVITDDVGQLNPREHCGCDWSGQSFRVTGRRLRAEPRGCGAVLDAPAAAGLRASLPIHSTEVVDAITGFVEGRATSMTLAEFEGRLDQVASEGVERLRALTLEEILDAISLLREAWRERLRGGDLVGLAREGGNYLYRWSDPAQLRAVLEGSVLGGPKSLDEFVKSGIGQGKVRAQSRGLVSQWTSGNVPLLGLYPVLLSWVTKSPVALRLSTRSQQLIPTLLMDLEALARRSPAAEALLGATEVVTFGSGFKAAHVAMSMRSSVRIAWGGHEAISSIEALPRATDSCDLFYGPRTSFAVIWLEAVPDASRLGKLAKRVARDAFVFQQAACASPHTVFLVGANDAATGEFAQALLRELEHLEASDGVEAEPAPGLATERALARRMTDLRGEVHCGRGSSSVLVTPFSGELPEPVFGHTVWLQSVDTSEHVLPTITPLVQSIGLWGPEGDREKFATAAATRGARRFPDIGAMTNYEEPWDGRLMASAFVEYVTLGGPS